MADTFLNGRVEVVQADITTLSVDAIVNAANRTLLGGGGVDGAIHRRAGPQLLHECRGLNGCETGDAKATSGYNLPAQWVFHTVGPVWHGGHKQEAELLTNCYRRCLELAAEKGANSVAFPAVSTGVYRYPKLAATNIAIGTTSEFLAQSTLPARVVFCCFSDSDVHLYQSRCSALLT